MNVAATHSPLPSELFHIVISRLQEGVCILDSAQKVVLVNLAAEKILGWPQEALLHKDWHEVIHQNEEMETPCGLLQRLGEDKPYQEYEAFFQKRNGADVFVKGTISLVNIKAEIWRILTFQAAAEQAFPNQCALADRQAHKKAFAQFRRAFETNMFGMVYGDFQRHILEANQAFLDMVGYSLEDFKSGLMGWDNLTPAEYAELDAAAIRQLKDFGFFHPYEKQFIRKDGSRVDVLLGGIIEEESLERALCFVIDISAKKRVERSSLKGEELFRKMADSSSALIWFITADYKMHYFNKTVLDYCGYSMDQFPKWEEVVHPDDLPTVIAMMRDTYEKRTRFESIHRNRRADGQYRWVYATGVPVFSDSNEFLGYVGTAIDIHDLKETQARLTEYAHKLEQSNKELEHFATIASHDLQEPLRKVMVFSDHLMQISRGSLKEEALDDLERIQNATGRMQQLIEDLLDLSRVIRRKQPFRKVDLKALIEEVVAELRYAYADIRERIHLEGEMTIDADINQLRQMMVQLLDNALKFHEPGQPSFVTVNVQPAEENQCRIMVSDNGLGIKPEYFSRIFDTFTRLHSGLEYPGTGIGLALVKKIVERHDGRITVESTLGVGSTFIVTLPVSQRGKH